MPRGGGSPPVQPTRQTLRTTSAKITMIAAGVVSVLLLGDAGLRAGAVEMLRLTPWLLFALWMIYVTMYASSITYDGAGVTVQNYLRRTWVPWTLITDVSLRWQIVFTLAGGTKVKAYGGPAGGPTGRRGERGSSARPGASAAAAVGELEELREMWQEHATTPSTGDRPTRSWDIPALLALAAIVAGAVISVLSVRM